MIAWIALGLAGIAAFFSWRLSRPISVALWLAFGSTCGYALAMQHFPEAHARGTFEPQRLVSLVVGSAGVYELIRRQKSRVICDKNAHDAAEWEERSGLGGASVWRELMERGVARWKFGRVDMLAIVVFASACVDMAALCFHRAGWKWALPPMQIFVEALMIGICLREGAKP